MKTVALFIALFGFAGCDHPASPRLAKEVKSEAAKTRGLAGDIGSILPEFSAKGFDGEIISSADLRGKVVLIDFWATWCEPCKREMPGYQELAARYGSRGFAVIGFKATMMSDTEDPFEFARNIGVHYPLVNAGDEVTRKFGGLEGLPTTLLYDRRGVLRKKIIGFEYTAVIEAEVKRLL